MKKILILGANGDLAQALIKNLNKSIFKIYKLKKKNINFFNINSKTKLFYYLQKNKPDIIINCIGLLEDNKGDFTKIFKANLYPSWLLVNYFIKNKNLKVKIILVGSSSFNKPRKNYILYTAAKTALNNLYKSAKDFFKETKVNFYIINPPAMNSRMRLKSQKFSSSKKNFDLGINVEIIAKEILDKFKIR